MYSGCDMDILLASSKKCAPAGTRHIATLTTAIKPKNLSSMTFLLDWFRHSQHQNRIVCNMGASLYEPINVNKPVAPNIGIVDGPFEYLTVGGAKLPLPFTTRMTVVRLSNGELFLHSPVKFDVTLANELLGLGAVRHL